MKVFRSFKELSRHRVEFTIGQLVSQEKLEQEVLPKYPKQKEEIQHFVNQIKASLKIAVGIILSIIIAGIILSQLR